jgi:hypothetical protein
MPYGRKFYSELRGNPGPAVQFNTNLVCESIDIVETVNIAAGAARRLGRVK